MKVNRPDVTCQRNNLTANYISVNVQYCIHHAHKSTLQYELFLTCNNSNCITCDTILKHIYMKCGHTRWNWALFFINATKSRLFTLHAHLNTLMETASQSYLTAMQYLIRNFMWEQNYIHTFSNFRKPMTPFSFQKRHQAI